MSAIIKETKRIRKIKVTSFPDRPLASLKKGQLLSRKDQKLFAIVESWSAHADSWECTVLIPDLPKIYIKISNPNWILYNK